MTPFICVLWLVFSSALVQLFWRAVYDCSQQLYFLIFHSPVVFLSFICIVFSFIFISKLWITNTKRVRRVRYSFYWVTWKWILCLMLAYLHHHAARALSLFSSSLSSISDFIFHTAQLELRALDSRKKHYIQNMRSRKMLPLRPENENHNARMKIWRKLSKQTKTHENRKESKK